MGRAAELSVLEREHRRAAAGEFRSVLLRADAGLGKTRLASEFLARKRGRAITLSARAYPFGASVSFGVWSEALESHLRQLDAREVSEQCGGFVDDLASLIRSAAAVRGSVSRREPPRVRLLEGLAILLANLSRRGSLVVFIDDAHLADASSWEALAYLARNIPDARVLVLAAARPAELGGNDTAMSVLLGLEQEARLERLELESLDRAALTDLASAVLNDLPPAALVEWSPSDLVATLSSPSACSKRSWTRAPTCRLPRFAPCQRSWQSVSREQLEAWTNPSSRRWRRSRPLAGASPSGTSSRSPACRSTGFRPNSNDSSARAWSWRSNAAPSSPTRSHIR